MIVLLCLGLAYGCYLAWRGHGGQLDPMDPIGDWDEVLASLAVTDLAGAECALADARRERKRAMDRLRRAQRGLWTGGGMWWCPRTESAARAAAVSGAMVAHWTAIRDEFRAWGAL